MVYTERSRIKEPPQTIRCGEHRPAQINVIKEGFKEAQPKTVSESQAFKLLKAFLEPGVVEKGGNMHSLLFYILLPWI